MANALVRKKPNARLPPIVDATHVPCGSFSDDVAFGSVAPGTKFSPPITRLVAAQVAALVALEHSALAVLDVPESMSADDDALAENAGQSAAAWHWSGRWRTESSWPVPHRAAGAGLQRVRSHRVVPRRRVRDDPILDDVVDAGDRLERVELASGTVTARPSAFANSYVTLPPSAVIRCLTASYGFFVLTMTRWSADATVAPTSQINDCERRTDASRWNTDHVNLLVERW